jgi:hypothetical protein
MNEQSEHIEKRKAVLRGRGRFHLAKAEGKRLRLPAGDGGQSALNHIEQFVAIPAGPAIFRASLHNGPMWDPLPNAAAMDWLEKSIGRVHRDLNTIRFDPLLKPVHGDPRFEALSEKIALVHAVAGLVKEGKGHIEPNN